MVDQELYDESKSKMQKSIESMKKDFIGIRTGRATPAILDSLKVPVYGQDMSIKQVASVSVPEPRMIVIQPWDKGVLSDIEKSILKSDLGINPSNDGKLIRLIFPPLTEERRKELVKVVKKRSEEGKVAIRNIRREAIDYLKEIGDVASIMVEDLGEIDSADPVNLESFINWSKDKFPAKKYALALWNHGGGWKDKDGKRPSPRSIIGDDTSGNYIETWQVTSVLQHVYENANNKKMELVGTDACLMGGVEFFYDMSKYCNYGVASETSITGKGWPYNRILQNLSDEPTMGGNGLAPIIGRAYTDEYSGSALFDSIVAVDLSKMADLKTALDAFAAQAILDMSVEQANILLALTTCMPCDSSYSDYRDVGSFMDEIILDVTSSDLRAKAYAVKTALSAVKLYESHNTTSWTKATGLSIWLPSAGELETESIRYPNMKFGAETKWLEMLTAIYTTTI